MCYYYYYMFIIKVMVDGGIILEHIILRGISNVLASSFM